MHKNRDEFPLNAQIKLPLPSPLVSVIPLSWPLFECEVYVWVYCLFLCVCMFACISEKSVVLAVALLVFLRAGLCDVWFETENHSKLKIHSLQTWAQFKRLSQRKTQSQTRIRYILSILLLEQEPSSGGITVSQGWTGNRAYRAFSRWADRLLFFFAKDHDNEQSTTIGLSPALTA